MGLEYELRLHSNFDSNDACSPGPRGLSGSFQTRNHSGHKSQGYGFRNYCDAPGTRSNSFVVVPRLSCPLEFEFQTSQGVIDATQHGEAAFAAG